MQPGSLLLKKRGYYMTLNDCIDVLDHYFYIKIVDSEKKLLYAGIIYNLAKPGTLDDIDVSKIGLTGEEKVNKLVSVPEITHKRWKEKNLMAPILPDRTPDYTFSDLQMMQYYEIRLAG